MARISYLQPGVPSNQPLWRMPFDRADDVVDYQWSMLGFGYAHVSQQTWQRHINLNFQTKPKILLSIPS